MNYQNYFKKCSIFLSAFLMLICLLTSNSLFAQQGSKVTGSVKDAKGVSIPGVNILEKGTKNSVATDMDGNFSIVTTEAKTILVLSYLGYQTQEINSNGKNSINVILLEENEKLQEVVVVGYGTVKKKDLTGSVNTLSAETLTQRNNTSPI